MEKEEKKEECKCQEYLNNWKRAAADLINYKKDEMERVGQLIEYSRQEIILDILPVLDNLCLASLHIKDAGIDQIIKQFQDFLKKEGIEEVATENQKFNPETMEIVEMVEGGESGVVAQEVQKGYTMNGKVLRVAKVKINK